MNGPRTVGRTPLSQRGSYSTTITIITEARDESGIGEGDEVEIHAAADHLVLMRPGGSLPSSSPSLTHFGSRTIRSQGKASVYVTLPSEVVDVLGWEQTEPLEVRASEGVVTFIPW